MRRKMERGATVALGAFLLACLIGVGCGEKDEPATETPAASAEEGAAGGGGAGAGTEGGEPGGGSGDGDGGERPAGAPGSGPAESGSADPRLTAAERAAARAVRSYVAAIDARDGARLCNLLAPGALAEIRLPRERGGCAGSLSASIGYRDPRGLPVFEQARFAELISLQIEGDEAKAVATVVTVFADRTEPSMEDDVIYLLRAGDGWAVAKPSSTLYRAIGAEAPPTVVAPP